MDKKDNDLSSADQNISEKIAHAKILTRQTVFDGFHKLEEVNLLPRSLKHDGYTTEISREIFHCGRVVSVLLYIPETDEVLLNQQFRAAAMLSGAADPFLIECCAGGVDHDESLEDAARREALEETGAVVGELEYISAVYPSPSSVAEVFHLYAGRITATDAGFHGLEDEGEEIRTHRISARSAIDLLDDGKITNATTALMMHWFARNHERLRNKWMTP